MARHPQNPIGDRSGCNMVANPTTARAVPGTASALLNLALITRVVVTALLASPGHKPDGTGFCDPMAPGGRAGTDDGCGRSVNPRADRHPGGRTCAG